jgi:cysteate synthase
MMYGIENEDVFSGMDLFEKTEGIDIVPAAGVAVAALREAVNIRAVKSVDSILLNITGGGEKRLGREKKLYNVEPRFVSKKITERELDGLLCNILKKN